MSKWTRAGQRTVETGAPATGFLEQEIPYWEPSNKKRARSRFSGIAVIQAILD